MSTVLAVDGGGFKTHLALMRDDGSLLAFARGPHSSPHQIGVDGCLELLERLTGEALEQAGLGRDGRPAADVGHVMMAGVDFPREEEDLQAAVDARGWATRVTVANDTFAILRAGTDRGWGVALVCGAGMNCVGVGPDGTHVRHPALGAITGDWGGGFDVGLAGLSAAARSADGRGPKTALESAVPGHFGLGTPMEVAEAIQLDGLDTPADRRARAARAERGQGGRRGDRDRRAARERGGGLPAGDAGAAGADRRARRRGARRRPLPERRRPAGGADRRAARGGGPAGERHPGRRAPGGGSGAAGSGRPRGRGEREGARPARAGAAVAGDPRAAAGDGARG